jgi:hypothetical protein
LPQSVLIGRMGRQMLEMQADIRRHCI